VASFGERIRALRLATTVSERPHLSGTRWATDGHLSVNGLARLAQVDPAYVQHIEAARRKHPSVPVVLRFARALGCSERETAELLVSAGHWPWPDASEDTTALLLALAIAVLDGDHRPLEDHVRAGVEEVCGHARLGDAGAERGPRRPTPARAARL
jgi:transcriptional regulator with XRE-family HTH domain